MTLPTAKQLGDILNLAAFETEPSKEMDEVIAEAFGVKAAPYSAYAEMATDLIENIIPGCRILIDSDPDRKPKWRCHVALAHETGMSSLDGLTGHTMTMALWRSAAFRLLSCEHDWMMLPLSGSQASVCSRCNVAGDALHDHPDQDEPVTWQKSITDVVKSEGYDNPRTAVRPRLQIDDLYRITKKKLDGSPRLPCRIDEMTPREYAIFETTAYYVGFLKWLNGYLFQETVRYNTKTARDDIRAAAQAIDDWVATYASDMCSEEQVALAQQRIMQGGGTLAYTADVTQRLWALIDQGQLHI